MARVEDGKEARGRTRAVLRALSAAARRTQVTDEPGYTISPRLARELLDIIASKDAEIKKLSKMALCDHLTGRYSRAYFDSVSASEMALHLRGHGNGLTFIFIDLDHFKEINDTFGHDAGDAALRTVGNVLKVSGRGEDMVFRYAGDEFVVMQRGIGAAPTYMRRVRNRLKEEADGSNGICLSLSYGYCDTTEIRALEYPIIPPVPGRADPELAMHQAERLRDFMVKNADAKMYLEKKRMSEDNAQAALRVAAR